MEDDDYELSSVHKHNIHSDRIRKIKFDCLTLKGIVWLEYKDKILKEWCNMPRFLVNTLDNEIMVFKLIRMNYTKYGIDYRYILRPYNIAYYLNYNVLEKIYEHLPLLRGYVHSLSGIAVFYNGIRYDKTIIEDVITQASYHNNCSVLEFIYDNHTKEFVDFINMWKTYRKMTDYVHKDTILFIDNLMNSKLTE